MGAVKTIIYMFSYNQYLYYYINMRNIEKIEQILQKKPNLIKDPLTAVSQVTALNQACLTNNRELVTLLIDKYEADPNLPSPRGQTPLISAIRKNNVDIVKLLLSKGANPNYVDNIGFKTIQYAILQGLYEIASILYNRIDNKQLRPAGEYEEAGLKYGYRYVNYQQMLQNLTVTKLQPQQVKQNFLKRKKIFILDPVIDPRESWKQWFWRNMEFKNPPLVERSSLPQELRPENRWLGRVGNFFSRITSDGERVERKAQSQIGIGKGPWGISTGQKLQVSSC